nr:MATE family efflux transporter [uncultured Lachnoclostridium sp.]
MDKDIELKSLISKVSVGTFIGTAILALDSIVQAIYAGHILGRDGLVSIGSGFCIMLLFVALCEGAVAGTIGIVKEKYQAKDQDGFKEAVNVAWTVGIIVSLVLTVVGVLLSEVFLKALGTDESIMADALIYLRINLEFSGLVYFIFMCLELLKNKQKRWLSFVYIVTTTVLNIILIPLFASGVSFFPKCGIKAFAVIPLITGTIGCILSIVVLAKEEKGLFQLPTKLSFQFSFKEVVKRGTPALLPKVQAGISYLIILFFVNKYGAYATGAFYIVTRIDSLVTLPAIAVMTGIAVGTGQVMASKQIDRLKIVVKQGVKLMAPTIVIIAFISFFFSNGFMHVFTNESEIQRIGASYLKVAAFGYLFFIAMYVSNGILYGMQKSVYTTYFSLIAIFIVRLPVIWICYAKGYGIDVVWKIIIASYIISTLLSVVTNVNLQRKIRKFLKA